MCSSRVSLLLCNSPLNSCESILLLIKLCKSKCTYISTHVNSLRGNFEAVSNLLITVSLHNVIKIVWQDSGSRMFK